MEILIGIDPGTTTGVAIKRYFQGQPYMELMSGTITQMMEVVKEYNDKADSCIVMLEDARKRQWFGINGGSKLQGAGSIKRDCAIWEDWLNEQSIIHTLIHPKDVVTKMDGEQFTLLTGIKKSNQHQRDACMIVWGVSYTYYQAYLKEYEDQ